MHITSDLKIQFLGTIPILADQTGTLTPEQIVALAGLLSFKGKSIKALLDQCLDKGENLQEKTKTILKNSSLRGHASIATTPALAFSFEGSKFLDSALTGIIFASGLMASGRRTSTTPDDIVFPDEIYKNQKAREIYQEQSRKNIDCFNWLLSQNVSKDEASKILQYGIYGTGILTLPIECLIGLVREMELESNWLPHEIEMFLTLLQNEFSRLGIKELFETRLAAPRDIYPYPNIFKNPAKPSLVREIKQSGNCLKKVNQFSKITNCQLKITKGLKQKLKALHGLTKTISRDRERILKEWPALLALRREISRDYNLAVEVQVLSSVAWRVWSEKKRHRTVPQSVESIYYCLEKALKTFNEYKVGLRTQFLGGELSKVALVFSLPPTINQEPKFLSKYLACAAGSLRCYQQLIGLGIKPRDALFVVPRALRINVLQSYNLYNLISGYYPLRLCSTVDEQLLGLTAQETLAIKAILKQKKFPELADVLQVKCHHTCFCSERNFCSQIKAQVPGYDEEFHQRVLDSLEERYNLNRT